MQGINRLTGSNVPATKKGASLGVVVEIRYEMIVYGREARASLSVIVRGANSVNSARL